MMTELHSHDTVTSAKKHIADIPQETLKNVMVPLQSMCGGGYIKLSKELFT